MKNTNTLKQGLMYTFFVALFMSISNNLSAQIIFFENFQDGMPSDFTIVDNDGRTVVPELSDLFPEAWVVDEDLLTDGNLIAVSTSWYTPPGASDDWMILPPITIPDGDQSLIWNARARDANFPDGYEVRISTTDSLLSSFTDVLFSIGSESNNWTKHIMSLSNYAGQRVYIAFRNNSSDQFILEIDDISVGLPPTHDVAVRNPGGLYKEYTFVPISQALPFELEVEVVNLGTETIDSVVVEGIVVDGTGTELLFSDDMGGVLDSLGAGESRVLTGSGSYIPPDTGIYFLGFEVTMKQEDPDTNNNFVLNLGRITDSTFARNVTDVNEINGLFGVPDQNIIHGHTFEVSNLDTLTSISAIFIDPPIGDTVTAYVYSMAGSSPVVGDPLYTSVKYVFDESDDPNPGTEPENLGNIAFVNFPFDNAILPPGNWLFAVGGEENVVRLLGVSSIYTPGVAHIFGFGQWIVAEDFYVDFESSFYVRPNFASVKQCNISVEVVTTPDDGSPNGTAVANVSGGTEPYTFEWSSGQTTSTAVLLSAGAYTVTVTDALGCSVTEDVNIIAVSIEDDIAAGLNRFDLYPNPNNGQFKIDIELAERDDLQIVLLDAKGRSVYTTQEKAAIKYEENINVGRLASGLYTLKVNTSKGTTFKRVLID